MSESTTGQPHYTEADATAQFCQNSQVLVGRHLPTYNYQSPTGTDNSSRPFGGDCHGHNDIYVDGTRHSNRCYLCGYSDSLYEPCKFGAYPYGRLTAQCLPWKIFQTLTRCGPPLQFVPYFRLNNCNVF